MRRQRRRQRRLMFCFGLGLLAVATLWQGFQMPPKYPWLKPPKDFYQPALFATPATYAPGQQMSPLPLKAEDTVLKQKLTDYLASFPETLKPHLFYYHVQAGEYVNIAGQTPVAAASVIKLPILMDYLAKWDQGLLTPHTHLLYQEFEQAGGSGGLQYKPLGQPMLAEAVATEMIQSSDNTCTNMLIYALGGVEELNIRFRQWGFTGTRINNWLPDLPGTNVISMQDMATLLYNLEAGPLLSDDARQKGLEILAGTHNRRLLPALLPKGTFVAHKTGDIGTSLGNAGLIVLPDGQHYIVAIQVERPYNDYTAKTMIQEVSRIIYEELTARSSQVRGSQVPATVEAGDAAAIKVPQTEPSG